MAVVLRFFHASRVDLTALLVVIIWGISAPFRKAALAEFEVLPFTALRFLGMLILGWIVLLRYWRISGEGSRFARSDWPSLILSGLCGYTVYLLIGLVGLHYTTAFSNSLLLATAPLFAALILRGLRLESIHRFQWLGMCLAFVGVALFVWEKAQAGFRATSVGDLISLAAALGFAIYTVVNKRLLTRHSQIVVMTYTLTIGALPALAVSIPSLPAQDWSRVTLLGWSALLWTIVIGVYLAWTLWNWVLAHMSATRTTAFLYLVPMVSGLFSWQFLGEHFGWLKIAGGLVILMGLMLARMQKKGAITTVNAERDLRWSATHTAVRRTRPFGYI